VPDAAAKRQLVYVIDVRGALKILGGDNATLVESGAIEDACALLVRQVLEANEARLGRK
jgi:hypothetical protein